VRAKYEHRIIVDGAKPTPGRPPSCNMQAKIANETVLDTALTILPEDSVMPLPEEVLRCYVSATASVALSDASVTRLTHTCAVAADAVQALAAQSLFDTEPEQLHTVLESLAEDDPA
jgi:hypothetical protein